MSKFIERLQQVFQPPTQSMGFNTAKPELARPKLQLLVNITGAKLKSQIKEPDEADALTAPFPAVDGDKVIWGKWLSKGDAEEVEKATKAGVDFLILPVSGEVIPQDKKIGKIIQIEASITDILLRTVSSLPVDAVLLSGEENGLAFTWKRLMSVHRFSSLTGKPVLIEVLTDITEIELQEIWEAGVSGIIVTTDIEQVEDVTRNLRNVIDRLSFPSRRKREKSLAIVPRIEITPEEPKEDDGDDDD